MHGHTWAQSLNAKLRAITVLLFVSSAALITSNVVLLHGMRGNAGKQKLFGQGTSYAYQLLAAGYRFAGESGAARERTAIEMREIVQANQHRYDVLLRGAPEHDIRAVADPAVRASVMERSEQWRYVFAPAVERLIGTTTSEQARGALTSLEPLLEDYARRTIAGSDDEQRVLTAQVERVTWLQYVFAAFVVIVIAVVVWLAQQTSSRATGLATVARRIADGELGLEAPSRGHDELAQLGQAFNRMTRTLRDTIDSEKKGRTRVEGLLSAISETASSLVSCASEIMSGTSEQTAAAQTQAAAVAQTVTTVDEALRISGRAEQQAGVVAAAAERSVQTGKLGRKALDGAINQMAELQQRTEGVAESILVLAERTQTIGQITSAISEIADQTNVLALNASIEASRAGAYGTTFRVVANEVRGLAEQCKSANTQVRQLLEDIHPATARAMSSIEMATKGANGAMIVVNDAGDTIKSLLDTIDQASKAATEIAGSARQQSAGMAQIHVAMLSVNQAANQNLASTEQAGRAAHELSQRGRALEKLLAG